MSKPRGSTAVMARRQTPFSGLDYFPTPPWATRALMEKVIPTWTHPTQRVWEPASGGGHMSSVLEEYFADVRSSDVHDYGIGAEIGSFTGGDGPLIAESHPDWIITNPPFVLAIDFARRAIELARFGAALLVRLAFLEGVERHGLFMSCPPAIVAPFAERVPMVEGRWDPEAKSATAYCWIVWTRARLDQKFRTPTEMRWIPSGCRAALTRRDDLIRFGPKNEADTLFSEARLTP